MAFVLWVEDDLITSFPGIIKKLEKSDVYILFLRKHN